MSSSLSTSWLSARLGRDRQTIDRLRRSGQLLGVRGDGGYVFPAWQFDAHGRVLPALPRVIAVARSLGLSDERLAEVLQLRLGLTSDTRVADSLRDGKVERVLTIVRAAADRAA
jgi:hypothetical protein